MSELTVSAKGWVVIPADLRKKYDLHAGARVMLVDYGGVLAIVPALKEPIRESAGISKGKRSLTSALKQEHARELAREQSRGRRHGR